MPRSENLFGPGPCDYFGSHRDQSHDYGGFASNIRSQFNLLNKNKLETSTTRRDFVAPSLAVPAETTGCGNVFPGRSGFNLTKALHNPTTAEVIRAKRAQAQNFYNMGSKIGADCTIPISLMSENRERYNEQSLTYDSENCGLSNAKRNWMGAPGSRDSAFTNGFSTINPVYWRNLNPLMDQLGKNPPEIRSNAASVSQTDYQPHCLVNYEHSPIMGILATRGKPSGFVNSKELKPCFLPEPCVYGKHEPSYIGDPSRFDTTYGAAYKGTQAICDWRGMPILSRSRPNLKSTTEESPDFSLGCGSPRSYLTETREKFMDHWPLEGQRNFGLNFPICKVSPSGYVHSVKKHGRENRTCMIDPAHMMDTSPQRFNPWPRFYLGHRKMIEKTYRPNPLATGIDYTVTTALPTTSPYEPSVFLY